MDLLEKSTTSHAPVFYTETIIFLAQREARGVL